MKNESVETCKVALRYYRQWLRSGRAKVTMDAELRNSAINATFAADEWLVSLSPESNSETKGEQ